MVYSPTRYIGCNFEKDLLHLIKAFCKSYSPLSRLRSTFLSFFSWKNIQIIGKDEKQPDTKWYNGIYSKFFVFPKKFYDHPVAIGANPECDGEVVK